jgi:hypothetical protein
MPDSVWGRRHLIFVAVTLLLLTSVPYWRLRSRTVRLVGALVCTGWVYAVIQHHLMPDDRNTPMDVFVVKMLNQEQGLAGPIHFYAVDRYLHFSVWFYVETLKAQRITGFTLHFTPQELERLSKSAAAVQIHQNVKIEEARGAHFWVATSSYSWKQKTTPQEVMIQRGCRVGPEVKVSDRYHVTAAFPVWCDSVR